MKVATKKAMRYGQDAVFDDGFGNTLVIEHNVVTLQLKDRDPVTLGSLRRGKKGATTWLVSHRQGSAHICRKHWSVNTVVLEGVDSVRIIDDETGFIYDLESDGCRSLGVHFGEEREGLADQLFVALDSWRQRLPVEMSHAAEEEDDDDF